VYRDVLDFEDRPHTSTVKIIHPLTLLYRRDMHIPCDTTQSKIVVHYIEILLSYICNPPNERSSSPVSLWHLSCRSHSS